MSDPYPAGSGHDRQLLTDSHPHLAKILTSDDVLSLDAGFWGVEKYALSPPRHYKIYLPPNPATTAYRKLSDVDRLRFDMVSSADKVLHNAVIERVNGRLKDWAALNNRVKWRHNASLLGQVARLVTAILNHNADTPDTHSLGT